MKTAIKSYYCDYNHTGVIDVYEFVSKNNLSEYEICFSESAYSLPEWRATFEGRLPDGKGFRFVFFNVKEFRAFKKSFCSNNNESD